MIQAPARLAHWLPELEPLPGDLALGIYPMVARLEAALGPHTRSAGTIDEEPEGYGGVVRRGTYARLLPTEWLLASELPDEFMRRAVHAEHMFFELARRHRGGTPRVIVLFDTGPSQLGAPRLGHLAALIAFARRAQAAAAQLSWGVLQRPAAVHVDVSPATIERLLASRSAQEPTVNHALFWQSTFGELQRDDDAWLVGGPELARLPVLDGWPRLQLEQSLDPAQRCVEVTLEHHGRPPRRLVLALPDERSCVQLLRDPYERAQPALQRPKLELDSKRPLWFSHDGRRLFAWLRDGSAVSFPVPGSARATAGKPRIFRPDPGETLLACGSSGKRVFGLSQGPAGVIVHGAFIDAKHVQHAAIDVDPQDLTAWSSGIAFECGRRLHVLSTGGQLLVQDRESARFRATPRVLLAAPIFGGGGVVRVLLRGSVEDPAVATRLQVELDGRCPRSETLEEVTATRAPSCRAFFGYGAHRRWLLTQTSPDEVCLRAVPLIGRYTLMRIPEGTDLHGITEIGDSPSLVLLERDQRTVALLGRDRSHTPFAARSPIAQLCASQARPHIAYLTHTGELVVHRTDDDAPLLRIAGEVPA